MVVTVEIGRYPPCPCPSVQPITVPFPLASGFHDKKRSRHSVIERRKLPRLDRAPLLPIRPPLVVQSSVPDPHKQILMASVLPGANAHLLGVTARKCGQALRRVRWRFSSFAGHASLQRKCSRVDAHVESGAYTSGPARCSSFARCFASVALVWYPLRPSPVVGSTQSLNS